MRALKNILIGLGAVFLVVIALLVWTGVSSSQFRKEEAPFIKTFVADLSKRWDIADVHDRMTDPFLEQVRTPQAQQLLQQFKQLGGLISVHDVELRSYNLNNNGRTGRFSLKGEFENGEAVISITIVRKDGVARVFGFYLKGTHMRDGGAKLQT